MVKIVLPLFKIQANFIEEYTIFFSKCILYNTIYTKSINIYIEAIVHVVILSVEY